ncbi:MAG: type II toxin-antitoxin system PemK/MazF family toxin [Gammaproteobacteria bacterium]
MKRGDLVTVALPGDYGKPRPALLFQSDLFGEHPSATVLPVTSELRDLPLFRVTVGPDDRNGLAKVSQVMVDKIQTVSRHRLGNVIGHLEADVLLTIERRLVLFLGLGG